jgi:hypothetical protein
MPDLDPAIVQYIKTSPTTDLGELTTAIKKRFGVLVSLNVVGNILRSQERMGQLDDARNKAAGSVTDMVLLQQDAIRALSELAFDAKGLDIKDRVMVLKELRQWVGQSIEVSGLYDEKTNALFQLEWEA